MEEFTFKDYLTIDKMVKKSIEENNQEEFGELLALRSKIYLNIVDPVEDELTDNYINEQLKDMKAKREELERV